MAGINRRSLQALMRTAPAPHVCTKSTKIAESSDSFGDNKIKRRVLFYNTHEGNFCGFTEVHYRQVWRTEEPFHTIGYGKVTEAAAIKRFERKTD